MGCEDLTCCQALAMDLVLSQCEKWRPEWGNHDTSLDLTPKEAADNIVAEKFCDPILFDPSIQTPTSVEQYVRAFTKELSVQHEGRVLPQGHEPGVHENTELDGPEVTVACCGAVRAPRRHDARATCGIHSEELAGEVFWCQGCIARVYTFGTWFHLRERAGISLAAARTHVVNNRSYSSGRSHPPLKFVEGQDVRVVYRL